MLVCPAQTRALPTAPTGANDSANAWASSVGSGAISLRAAVVLGGFGEWLGATLLGYGVSDTIKKVLLPTQTTPTAGRAATATAAWQRTPWA